MDSPDSSFCQIFHVIKLLNLSLTCDQNIFSIFFEEDLISGLQLLFSKLGNFIEKLCRENDDYNYIVKQCYPFNKILSDCLRVLIPLTALLGNRFQYKLSDRSRKELGLLNQLQ